MNSRAGGPELALFQLWGLNRRVPHICLILADMGG
jgi:hypothetical protein